MRHPLYRAALKLEESENKIVGKGNGAYCILHFRPDELAALRELLPRGLPGSLNQNEALQAQG